jgi:hypothetical protein
MPQWAHEKAIMAGSSQLAEEEDFSFQFNIASAISNLQMHKCSTSPRRYDFRLHSWPVHA